MTREELKDTLAAVIDGLMEIVGSDEVSPAQRVEASRVVHDIVRQSSRFLVGEDDLSRDGLGNGVTSGS